MYSFNTDIAYIYGVARYYLKDYDGAYQVLSSLKKSLGSFREVDAFLKSIESMKQ